MNEEDEEIEAFKTTLKRSALPGTVVAVVGLGILGLLLLFIGLLGRYLEMKFWFEHLK